MRQLSENFKNGGWLTKAAEGIKHSGTKGLCTPMTKSTCTGRRRAFAITMKKHHGFHKKEAGGLIEYAMGGSIENPNAIGSKVTSVPDLPKDIAKRFKNAQLISSSRKEARLDLVKQGVKDRNQLLNYLNFDDKGRKTGDFTADEVERYYPQYALGGRFKHRTTNTSALHSSNSYNYPAEFTAAAGGSIGNEPDRYAPWGALTSTIKGEGWKPSLWNNDYTEYQPHYGAAGEHVQMNSGLPTGTATIRANKNGLFDILVRDADGAEKFIKQGIDANAAHGYFVSPQSTVKQRVDQIRSNYAVKEDGGKMRSPLAYAFMNGGSATPLSSDATEINGPSHAQGGVDVPQAGVNLEGGETTSGDFVFSKQLGFAKLHRPIARAIGKIEQKPQTRDRINALAMLHKREQNLAQAQETYKAMHGITN